MKHLRLYPKSNSFAAIKVAILTANAEPCENPITPKNGPSSFNILIIESKAVSNAENNNYL